MALNSSSLVPNMTPITQPMHQGLMRPLRSKCQSKIIHKYINAIDSNKGLPKIIIQDAMVMFNQSWSMLFDTAVVSCFKKADIFKKSQQDHCIKYARIRVFTNHHCPETILSLYGRILIRENPHSRIFYAVDAIENTN